MDLDQYQSKAGEFAVLPATNDFAIQEATLGLAGEAGEVCELVKKQTRGDGPMSRDKLAKELGDVLWYIARLADLNGLSLGHIADLNITKLEARKQAGTIQGSGSDR